MSKNDSNKSNFSHLIMIVENDRDFAESLSDILELENYQVIIADSAEEAKEKLKSYKPSISLIDIRLGLHDGIDLISDLKKISPDLLCVIVTAYAEIETAVKAIKKGVYDYLRKPLFIPDLLATLDRCYEKLNLEYEKKAAEEALSKSEEIYRKFYEEDITGDFIAKPDGRIILCNPPFAKIFLYKSVSSAMKSGFDTLFYDKSQWNDFIKKLTKEKKLILHEIDLYTKEGAVVNIIANVIGKFNSGNEMTEMNGYLMDITSHRRLEDMYLQSQKMEAIGRLAGGIAHDFNNLLSVILNFSIFIKESVDESTQIFEDIGEVIKATSHASKLVEQLLTFSRRKNMKFKVININEVIKDMKKMLERLIGENIELVTELDTDLDLIKADPGQISQVIMNLSVNSRDAMPDGGRLVLKTDNVEITKIDKKINPGIFPGKYIKLEVSDTGIGMNDEIKSHIFEPFFSTKEQGKGTGLGLATVFGIVIQSKGYISINTKKKKGVVFEILFPKTYEEIENKELFTETKKISNNTANILIAEDNNSLRGLISRILKKEGYKILLANNGKHALEVCEGCGDKIDLVVTDIIMPIMGGEELVNILEQKYQDLKVMYMSGYAKDFLKNQGQKLKPGMDYILKPFTNEEIVNKVEKLLNNK